MPGPNKRAGIEIDQTKGIQKLGPYAKSCASSLLWVEYAGPELCEPFSTKTLDRNGTADKISSIFDSIPLPSGNGVGDGSDLGHYCTEATMVVLGMLSLSRGYSWFRVTVWRRGGHSKRFGHQMRRGERASNFLGC